MSFLSEIEQSRNKPESSEPVFGSPTGGYTMQPDLPFPIGTVFRYYVGCLNDGVTRAEVSDLMTRSYRTQGILKNPGDIWVISETGTFDKNGLYNVVIKYAELPGASAPAEPETVPVPDAPKTTKRGKGKVNHG